MQLHYFKSSHGKKTAKIQAYTRERVNKKIYKLILRIYMHHYIGERSISELHCLYTEVAMQGSHNLHTFFKKRKENRIYHKRQTENPFCKALRKS